MSATLVQEQATTGNTVTSLAATLASGTTQHSGLIACVSLSSTGGGNSNITAPTGWSLGVTVTPVTRARVAIYYLADCAAGLTSFTFSFSTACDVAIHIQERANITTTSPLDVTASATTTTATATTGTTAATAQADELVVWCLGYADATALTYSSIVGTYTADALNTVSSTGAPQANLAVWYNETSATGTQNSGCTMSAIPGGDAHTSGCVIATFKVSSSAHSLEGQAQAKFLNAAVLKASPRATFSNSTVGKVQTRDTFLLSAVKKAQTHTTFVARAALSETTRAKFSTRTAFSVSNRAHFLLSVGLKVLTRAKAVLRASLASPSHAKFANRTLLREQTRGHFLLRSPLVVAARSTFKLALGAGHALGVTLRSHFLARQTSAAHARADFAVRTTLHEQARSRFFLRLVARVQGHSHFLLAVVSHTSARTTFAVKTAFKEMAHATFLLSYRLALPLRATFKLAVGVGHVLGAAVRVHFLARQPHAANARVHTLIRGTGMGTPTRSRFNARAPIGHVLTRTHFAVAGRLASAVRVSWLGRHTQQVVSRAAFVTRTWFRQFPRVSVRLRAVLSPSTRATFAVKTPLATRGRTRFLSRAALVLRSQSHAFTRTVLAVPGRTRFRLLLVLRTAAHTLSHTRTGLKSTARSLYEVRQALVAVAQDTFKVKAAPSLPLTAGYTSQSALSSSFATLAALAATFSLVQYSFTRSPSVASPNSTTTVTCTLKDKLGNLVSTASAVNVTVTFPDGSTQTFSLAGSTVVNLGSGQYAVTYVTKGVGEILEDWAFIAADGITKLEAHNVTPVTF